MRSACSTGSTPAARAAPATASRAPRSRVPLPSQSNVRGESDLDTAVQPGDGNRHNLHRPVSTWGCRGCRVRPASISRAASRPADAGSASATTSTATRKRFWRTDGVRHLSQPSPQQLRPRPGHPSGRDLHRHRRSAGGGTDAQLSVQNGQQGRLVEERQAEHPLDADVEMRVRWRARRPRPTTGTCPPHLQSVTRLFAADYHPGRSRTAVR